MLIEERCSTPDDVPHHTFELGQDVFDSEEKKSGAYGHGSAITSSLSGVASS